MARQIVTEYVYPPIPIRSMDWQATWDDFDGAPDAGPQPVGHGRTKLDAIRELLEPDQDDWISVNDALPPKDFLVLATDGKARWLDKYFDGALLGWAGKPLSFDASHLSKTPPTHWALLPDVPAALPPSTVGEE